MGIDYTRPSKPAASVDAASAPVSLSKITLTKAAPQVSLAKRGEGTGVVRVNLNWDTQGGSTGGFFSKLMTAPVDLDLGCLYELSNGDAGVVQALGGAFEAVSSTGSRVVWLDGDDRSGSAKGGENLFVDLQHVGQIRRILVFATIYSGAASWAAVNGVVTLYPPTGPEIEVRLDDADPTARICAIALIENSPSGLQVRREVRYVQGNQQTLDEAYGWGLTWTRGRK